ncbi:MAG TPA: macro domain-containing protein [Dehalococcoidia bacterium]|nr:macro domain-containing protein [Dehalococcoidia bacterium]
MIEYKTGDILTEDAEALVNTVNCVGFMGRGIALQFKRAYPDNFKAYEAACKRQEVEPGRMFTHGTGKLTNPRFIINFPTKRHWRGKSRLEDIESGLKDLATEIERRNIKSIAIPPLGAGLGGLNWLDVRLLIEQELGSKSDVRIVVFEPHSAPQPMMAGKSREVPRMTPGRAVLVGLMHRYLRGLLDPFVSLLEVHKLMYFMQEANEPLRLRFAKAPYGPYAENLRHVLQAVEGYYVEGYGVGGDSPDKPLQLIPGSVDDASAWLDSHEDSRARFERVGALVRGFESPFGLELLSTVHWIAKREQPVDDADLLRRVYEWNARKRQFSPGQVGLAVSVLRERGWL